MQLFQIQFDIYNAIQIKMQDKKKLIQSMENLISHIGTSRKNQQQIYETLSAADFRKIISNLEDPNEALRKTTLVLISELVYNNPNLQQRFCELMGIAPLPGKVMLSSKFPRAMVADLSMMSDVVKLLKDPSQESRDRGLFWYIDSLSKPIVLKMGHRNSFIVDPLQCIFGFWMNRSQKSEYSQPPKKHHLIERKTDPRSISQQKSRLNRSTHLHQQSMPTTPIANNYMAQSMRFPQQQSTHSKTEVKQRIPLNQFIKPPHTDSKNGYSSQHQEYSFTYIKPSMLNKIGPSSTTRNSMQGEVPYNRWEPNNLGIINNRR